MTNALDRLVIAVDGTSGSGKSSTCRGVAQALGLRYLDTGAMYRAMTWLMLHERIDLADADAITAVAERAEVGSGTDPVDPTITINGFDVSRAIREDDVTGAVSLVSAVPGVRAQLVDLQRAIIGRGGIVVEGRDIGTTVAPDAAVKVFLTADPEARAARRAAEVGGDVTATHESLLSRDAMDSSRTASPLTIPEGAVAIDSTHLRLEDVIDHIVRLAQEAVT